MGTLAGVHAECPFWQTIRSILPYLITLIALLIVFLAGKADLCREQEFEEATRVAKRQGLGAGDLQVKSSAL